MSHFETCVPVELVQSAHCDISLCKHCGAYHVHIGYMSLRLTEEVFQSICEAFLGVQVQQNPRMYKWQDIKPH